MKEHERLEVEEQVEAAGAWTAARHTVCARCDRYKVTDAERVCRRCAVATEIDTFEMEDAA